MENHERVKKVKSEKIRYSLLMLFIVLSITGFCLLYKFNDYFNVGWLIFCIFLVLIPSAIYGCKDFLIEVCHAKNDVRLNKALFLMMLQLLFFDSVFIAMYQDNLALKLCFGIIALLFIYFNVWNNFINRKKTLFFSFMIMIDFAFGIGLTIYLIYLIPNTVVQNITLVIVSTLYGGFLTLSGVSWTIKKADDDKKKEEILKNKPFLFVVDPEHMSRNEDKVRVKISDIKTSTSFNGKKKIIFNYLYLENEDFSFCSLKGIIINDDIIMFPIAQVLRKNTQYLFYFYDLDIKYDFEINSISLLVIDMLNNCYELEVNFKKSVNSSCDTYTIISGIEILPVDVDFCKMKINRAN